ncbi:MAG: 16S rRNA (cytosine(1402)-N(4))-methyltransferase RsmH [Candidatus Nomurabacteria bacterium]|jgi:16S rRNA (cytosine1402-N4)-methyltransferase|nr:16S rRNA (cytosine(1402)-N(4))-methyltransferase RsmH [Candidatus Nomurabacteria bacterium]
MRTPQQLHIPVLLSEVLTSLNPGPGESYLDLTTGYGGHAREILTRTQAPERATLVDRDQTAIDYLSGLDLGARLLHSDFRSAAVKLAADGETFDLILLDLGVSSPQLDNAARGFSFRLGGDLDMRMDQTSGRSAADLVNHSSEKTLAKIIRDYGEETAGRATLIARAIMHHRPIKTTTQLAEIVAQTIGRRGKIHPATRTFQALRIAVNDELGQLEKTLQILPKILAPGGRLAVISFHSLEDRIVKNFLRDAGQGLDSPLQILTKKPIVPTENEIDNNPRSRSAKLRAAVKINRKGLGRAN